MCFNFSHKIFTSDVTKGSKVTRNLSVKMGFAKINMPRKHSFPTLVNIT